MVMEDKEENVEVEGVGGGVEKVGWNEEENVDEERKGSNKWWVLHGTQFKRIKVL